jgi:hypothetical protein
MGSARRVNQFVTAQLTAVQAVGFANQVGSGLDEPLSNFESTGFSDSA